MSLSDQYITAVPIRFHKDDREYREKKTTKAVEYSSAMNLSTHRSNLLYIAFFKLPKLTYH